MTAFLVIEGTDGAGKTSLRKFLFSSLREAGRDVLTTTPFSWHDVESSRVIVEAKYHRVDHPPERITAAYVRDKELLSERLIRPHLAARSVLCDRFAASDMVYHQILWGIPPARTYAAFCRSRVRPPDGTAFIDTPPELAFARARARGTGGLNRWDRIDRQKQIYELFLEVLLSGKYPWLGPVVRIDNTGDRAHAEAEALTWARAASGPDV